MSCLLLTANLASLMTHTQVETQGEAKYKSPEGEGERGRERESERENYSGPAGTLCVSANTFN